MGRNVLWFGKECVVFLMAITMKWNPTQTHVEVKAKILIVEDQFIEAKKKAEEVKEIKLLPA